MLKREECGESSTRNHVVTLREREIYIYYIYIYSQPRQQQVYKGNAAFPSRMEVGLARNSDVLCVCVCVCGVCVMRQSHQVLAGRAPKLSSAEKKLSHFSRCQRLGGCPAI